MTYYPIFLDVCDRRCLVIGGGNVGLDKATGLLMAGAHVTVISPALDLTLQEWTAAGRIQHIAREYRSGDMAGQEIVMIATADRSANAAIRAEARQRGIWVNAADDPANCDFILPAVVRHGPMTLAISTGGGSPAMARRVREELTDYFTEDFEALAEMLAEVRADLKRVGALRTIDQATWQRAIDGALRALLAQRRWGQAKAQLLARLGPPVLPQTPAPAHPPLTDRTEVDGAGVNGTGTAMAPTRRVS